MHKRKCWLVVADEAIAKVFEYENTRPRLADVRQFTDPAAHSSESDGERDAAGRRGAPGAAGPSGSTVSAGPDLKSHAAERFAKQVAEWLEAERQQQHFDELRIVAAPRFLGALRKTLPKPLSQVVAAELSKDLIHLDHEQLEQQLADTLVADERGRR